MGRGTACRGGEGPRAGLGRAARRRAPAGQGASIMMRGGRRKREAATDHDAATEGQAVWRRRGTDSMMPCAGVCDDAAV
jgi:hypothetical protein